MALAAVITEPLLAGVGSSYFFAGYTYLRLHGYNSTLDAGLHEIVDYLWDDGEGHKLTGPIASFRYDTPGAKIIALGVRDSIGNVSATLITKTWATWSGTSLYVSASGNDTTGNGTIGAPYLTPDKAFTVAAGSVAQGAPVRVLLNQGDVLNSAGGTFPAPLLVDSYGSGAHPKIRIAAGQSLYGQTGVAWQNAWGYAVHVKNVDADWAAPDAGGAIRFVATSPGSSVIGSVIHNGKIEGSQSGSDPIALTWDGVNVSGATGGTGMGISNSDGGLGVGHGVVSFFGAINCYAHGNAAGLFTGNAYFHGSVVELRNCVFDGENNGVHTACFASGMQKYCVIGCVAKNATEGFGVGSNGSGDGSAEAQDAWFEGNYAFNCSSDGINFQYTNRLIVKNNIADSCGIGIYLNHTSHDLTQLTQNARVYNNVVYACGNQGIFTDGVRSTDIQNNIIYRTTAVDVADKKFIQLGTIAGDGTTNDYLFCTVDNNHYFSSAGDTSTTNGAFMENNSNRPFSGSPSWKGDGFDANGVFGSDPLFTNPASHDFTIQSTSPCRNTGGALPIVYRDYLGFVRSTADAFIDKGAYEFGANAGSQAVVAGTPQVGGQRLSNFGPVMKEVYLSRGGRARRG